MRPTPHHSPMSSEPGNRPGADAGGRMRRSRRTRAWSAALLSGVMATGALYATPASAQPSAESVASALNLPSPPGGDDVRVLVFHGSANEESPTVNAGIAALESIGRSGPAAQRFRIEATDDASVFTDGRKLGTFNSVVFLTGEGDVLNPEEELGLQAYLGAGGGFLGVHEAARTEPYSDWYRDLIGARATEDSGSVAQRATVEVGDREHPATADLPLEWNRLDRWLNWEDNPSGDVHTVARVRELDYEPGESANGPDHPISWCQDYAGGRSFYTAMGGTVGSWAEADFRDHLRGALTWTNRVARADCQATVTGNYVAERLTAPNQPGEHDQIGEPHGLVAAPDGRIFYISRGGRASGEPVVTDWNDPDIGKGEGEIHVWDPRTEEVSLVGSLTIFGNKGGGGELVKTEEGLLGIELDPRFASNGWIYLHWTPHSEIDRDKRVAERRVSRFTVNRSTGRLDLSSEKVLLDWEVQIHSCCHAGGGMAWDSHDNLYIATGDTNSSGFTGGYSGNNPEPVYQGISFADARRTSGNTNNLNGKILRIHPEQDGTYTLPAGNLFTGRETAEGGGKTKGEIYAMGVRNPSRIFVDKQTDVLYAGWVGPDASAPSPTWGPAKYESYAAITEPGNFGWPFCMGNNQPYRDRNLPNPDQPLGWYDCDAPRNESPHNDGLVKIPPITPVSIWYAPNGGGTDYPRNADGVPSYEADEEFQLLPWARGGGQAAMTGPVYRYDENRASDVKWPSYWDGKWFVGDFYDGVQPRHAVLLDPDSLGTGALPTHAESLKDIIPVGEGGIRNLMDWKFAPDGSLYVLDYGRGFFTSHSESALWRVTYDGGAPTPAAADLVRKGD